MVRPVMSNEFSSQPTLRDLFRNGNFVKFWTGQLISYLGDRIDQMAMIAVVSAGVSRSVGADHANMITFWGTLPYVLVSLFAGPIVDRFDRRKLMIVLDIFRALVVITLPFAISPEHDARVIYALVFLIGCATAIFAPAKSAFLPEIVPSHHLLRANSITSTMGTLTTLFGTIIGGALVSILARLNAIAHETMPVLNVVRLPLGLAVAFAIDAATYVVSALLLWLVVVESGQRSHVAERLQEVEKEGGFFLRLRDGFAFLLKHRIPALAAFTVSWFFFLGGAYFTLTTKLVYLRLVEGTEQPTLKLGYAYGILGLGLALGGIIAGRIANTIPLRYFISLCFISAGLFIQCNALPLPPKFLYLVNFAIGLTAGGVVVTMETVMQKAVHDAMRGRVFALNNLLLNTLLLGSLLAGAHFLGENGTIAARFGSIDVRIAIWARIICVLSLIAAGVAFVGFQSNVTIARLRADEHN
jgi:dTMP kinase